MLYCFSSPALAQSCTDANASLVTGVGVSGGVMQDATRPVTNLLDNQSTAADINHYDSYIKLTSSDTANPIIFNFSIPQSLSYITIHNGWGRLDNQPDNWSYQLYSGPNGTGTLLATIPASGTIEDPATPAQSNPNDTNRPEVGPGIRTGFADVSGVRSVRWIISSYIIQGVEQSTTSSAVAPWGEVREVVFTTCSPPGAIAVSKTVTGGPATHPAWDFPVTASCSTPAGTYSTTLHVAADAASGSGSISVPAGSTSCTISEGTLPPAPAGYTWGTPAYTQPPPAAITSGATVSAAVSNTLLAGQCAALVPLQNSLFAGGTANQPMNITPYWTATHGATSGAAGVFGMGWFYPGTPGLAQHFDDYAPVTVAGIATTVSAYNSFQQNVQGGVTGGSIIQFQMQWYNGTSDGSFQPARGNRAELEVVYGGVVYARFFTTPAGALSATKVAPTAGPAGTTVTASPAWETLPDFTAGSGTVTTVQITLPAGVPASGQLMFRSRRNNPAPTDVASVTDDFDIRNPVILSPSICLAKQSNGGTGTFSFNASNADTSLGTSGNQTAASITTLASGTAVAYDAWTDDSATGFGASLGVTPVLVIDRTSPVAITETPPAGFALNNVTCTGASVTRSGNTATITGVAASATPARCVFVNDAIGSLTVTKNVTGGPAAHPAWDFPISVSCQTPAAIYSGTIHVPLDTATGSTTISNIAAGSTNCTITEGARPAPPAGYSWGTETVVNPAAATPLPVGGSISGSVSNPLMPTPANVVITKALTGESGTQAGIAEPGETLTYTITLANSGGTAFANYDFVENIPAGATLTSVTGTGVTACALPVAGAGTCAIAVASVPALGSTTVTVALAVANPLPAGATAIANLISGGDIPTDCPAPNVCSVTTPTAASVTLNKALTAESGTQTGIAEPGETLTYTVTLTNNGGTAFSNFDFVENVPSGATLTSVTGTGVTACTLPLAGAGACNVSVASVPANGSATVSIVFAVANPLPAGTTSILNLVNGGDTPPGCAAPNNCTVTTPTPANVTVAKALTGESGTQAGIAEPGETLTYTVTLSNSGGAPFANYDFVENVPTGATLASVTGTGVTACITPLAGSATCSVTVASVPGGGSTTVSIVFTVANPLPAGTTAITNLISGGDTPPGCAAPNVCTVTTPVAARDLGDAPDSYGTLISSGGGAHELVGYAAGTNTAPLMLGALVDADVDGQPSTGADGDDLAGIDDEDAFTSVIVRGPGTTDIRLPMPLRNTSGAAATLYGWIDFDRNGRFDANEAATAAVPNGATSAILSWTGLSPLTAGQSYLRLRLTSATLVAGTAANGGDARAVNTAPDGEIEDHRFEVRPIDVVTPFDLCPTSGFLIEGSLSNLHSIAQFTGAATLLSTIPGNLNAMGFNPLDGRLYARGIQAGASGNEELSIYAIGAGGTYTVYGPPIAGMPTPQAGNVGDVDGDGYLHVTGQGTGAAAIVVSVVDVTPSRPTFMSVVRTYTRNAVSPMTATVGVDMAYRAQDGLFYSLRSGTDPQLVTINPTTGAVLPVGTITGLSGNFGAQYTTSDGQMVVIDNASGNVFRIDLTDPALPWTAAGTTGVTGMTNNDGASCPNQPFFAPITVAKSVADASGNGMVEPGEALTYTITLSNPNPVDRTGYDLTDTLDANTVFVSASHGGTHAAGTVTWNNLTVPAQAGATPGTLVLTVVVTAVDPLPPGATRILNLAHETGTTPPDCSALPQPAGCAELPTAANVTLAKTLTSESGTQAGVAEPGETLTYTVTLSNSGGTAFANYDFVENVPNSATLAAVTGAGVTACATPVVGAGTCNVTVASVPANGSTTVTIVFTVANPLPAGTTSILNLVNGGDTPPDCPAPNICSVTTPTPANVTIAKALTSESGTQAGIAEPGETLTYTVTLTNSGGTAFANYDFTENVPNGATLSAVTGTGVTACATPLVGAGTCPVTVASVPANGSTTVTIVFTVANPLPVGATSILNLVSGGDTPPDCPAPNICSVTTPTPASVTIAKALTNESGTQAGIAEPGETLTYTVTLTNSGGTAFTNYDFAENVPNGATLSAVTGTGVTACATPLVGAGACPVTVASVPANGSTTVTIVFTVANPLPEGTTSILNLVNGGDTPPDCPAPNICSVTTPTPANVTIAKALTSESGTQAGIAEPGETLTYTVTLTNSGGTAFSNYDFVENVPNGATLSAVTGAGVTACVTPLVGAGACPVTVASVPANGSTTVTIVFTLANPLPEGTTSILNLVNGGDTPPDCPAPNICSVTTPTPANVTIAKALTSESGTQAGIAEPGETLTYTVTLTNSGGTAFANYDFVENVPSGATLTAVTGTGVTACATPLVGAGACPVTVASVPANGSTTVTIVFTVANPLPAGTTSILNLVNGGDTPPDCPAPNICSVTTPTQANVTIAKVLTSESGTQTGIAEPGETLTYTVTLTNSGGTAFANYDFVENVPSGATLTAVTGTGVTACATPLVGAGACPVTVASVPANGSTTVTIVFTVANPLPAGTTSILNLVNGGDTPPDCPAPNICSVTTPTQANVTIAKVLTSESGTQTGIAEPGETLTYTVTLTNSGGTAFANYDFVENVPNGATLTAVTGAGVTACATPVVGAGACNVTVASVPANGSTTVTIVFTVANPLPAGTTSILNLVNGGDTPPDCPAPNICSVTTPTQANVTIAKVLTSESGTQTGIAEPGETLTYTVTLTNSGGTAFANYDFVENVPNGATLSAVTGTGVTACATPVVGIGTCPVTVASVPANGSTTVTIVFTVANPLPAGTTSILNLVNGGDTPPDCPAPNICSVTTPTQANVTIAKVLTSESGTQTGIAEPGETLTYTVTLTNSGGTAFANYDFVENVPNGATLTAVTGAGVTACTMPLAGAAACPVTVSNVPANGSTTVTIVFTVANPLPAGTTSILNLVNGGDTPPDCPAPNICSVTTPTPANVTIAKALTSESGTQAGIAEPGETLTYTVTLTNSGGTAFSNYDFVENVPNGATLSAVTGAGVTACVTPLVGAGACPVTVASVPANGSTTVTIVFTVANPLPEGTTSILNLVNGGDTPPDCPAPNICSVTTPTPANVTIAKALTSESGTQAGIAEPGETLTYTVTLTNSGGTAFTNYDFVENVPNGATLSSVTGMGVTACATPVVGAGTCPVAVASVPANGSTTVTIVFTVASPLPAGTTSILNLVNGGDTPPDCPAPNTCTVTTPTPASVTIAKALTSESGTQAGIAEPGETLTYTVTLSNSGGTAFANYDFVENVPSGATLTAVTGTGVTACATPLVGAGACPVTVASVPANGSTTVTIVFTVADPLPAGTTSILNLVNGGDTPPDCPAPNICSVTTPTQANVTIAKVLTSESGTQTGIAEPGETLTYTVTLTNSGGTAFANYDFVENVPNGATLTAVTGAGVTACTMPLAGAAACPVTVSNVPANGSTTVTIVFTVANPLPAGTTSILNLVNGGDTPPDCPAPNICSVTTPTQANVTIAKALTSESGAQAGIAEPGETLTYTVTLTNSGGSAFANYDFVENVPNGATLSAVTGTGVTTTACALPLTGTGTCNVRVASVPANGSTTVTIVFTVANPLPAGTTSILNLVNGGDTPPDCPAPNICSVTTPTPASVTIAKVLTSESGTQAGIAEPGETLTYTVTLTNSGGTGFANYDFVENVPNGATLTAVTGAGATACATPVVGASSCNVTVASVPANGSATVTIVFTVANPLPAGTTSILNLVNGGDTPPDCPVPNICSVTTPTPANVTIAKALTSESGTQAGIAEPGETLTYTVTLTNSGGTAFANYDFVENVPSGATLTAVTGTGVTACATPLVGAGACPVTVASVPANGSTTVTIVFTVANPLPAGTTSILNLVNGGDTPPDCPAPNICSVTTPTQANVTIAKVLTSESGAQAGIAEPGETLTYTVTLTNSGGTAFANYDFVENVPNGATLTAVTGAGVTACTMPLAGAAACPVTVSNVPANGSTTVTIVFTVANPLPAGPTSILNLVNGGDTPPDCPAPNICSVTTPTQANVTIAKVLTSESGTQTGIAEPGETLTYTVTLTNSGGTAFANYDFVENVPNGATLSAVTGTGVTACATPLVGAGACPVTVASVPANGSTTVTIVFTVANPLPAGTTSILNLVNGGDIPSDCPAPNICSVTTPTGSNVTVVKALTSESGTQAGIAEPGETLTYTVTLTNSGGTAFANYDFVENVPNGATLTAVTGTGVTTTACALPLTGTGTCNVRVASVPANGSTTATIVFTVANPLPAGTTSILNLVNGGDTPPDCPAPNICSVTTPTGSNVTVVKALTSESGTQAGIAEPGETLTYTVTLTNSGGTAFANYDFVENVPSGATLASVTGTGVTTTACALPLTGTGTCNVRVASVPANGSTTVTIVFTVANPLPADTSSIVNLINGGDTPPDCPAPNVCSVTTPTAGRVTIAKTVADASGNGIAEPGEALTWTITLSNHGGAAVSGYGLTDPLDVNTQFVSASGGGTHAAGTVTWTGLTIPAQVGATPGQLVLTVVTQVRTPIPQGTRRIANLAYETAGTPPDCTLSPVPANCASIPTAANISVGKALSGESLAADGIAAPGEQLTYTITLRNHGGTVADDVIVNERVPLHTTFVSGNPGWTCAAGSPAGTACDALVDVPGADAGGSPGVVTLTFVVRVDDPLPAGVQHIANAVALGDTTPPDCLGATTNPQCVVTPTINLNFVKSVESVTSTGPGTYWVAYRIDLANTGGSPISYTLTDTPDFTTAGVTISGNGVAATTGGTLNPALPGGSFTAANGTAVQISAGGVVLAVGATHRYTVRIPIAVSPGNVANGACTGAPGNGLYNRASVTGSFAQDSSTCSPVSSDQPLIRLVKSVALGVDVNHDRFGNVGDVLHYTFVISNPGNVPLSAIDLIDPRVTDLSCDATTAGGRPLRVLRGDELFFDAFEALLGGALLPGDSMTCRASYTITAEDVVNRRIVNTATTHGAGSSGQVVSSTSTAIYTNIR